MYQLNYDKVCSKCDSTNNYEYYNTEKRKTSEYSEMWEMMIKCKNCGHEKLVASCGSTSSPDIQCINTEPEPIPTKEYF